MPTPLMLLTAAILLAGCATPAQQAAYKQQDMDRRIAIYGPACNKLGFNPNTDQWRNCMLQLNFQDEASAYANYPPYYHPHWGYRGRF